MTKEELLKKIIFQPDVVEVYEEEKFTFRDYLDMVKSLIIIGFLALLLCCGYDSLTTERTTEQCTGIVQSKIVEQNHYVIIVDNHEINVTKKTYEKTNEGDEFNYVKQYKKSKITESETDTYTKG